MKLQRNLEKRGAMELLVKKVVIKTLVYGDTDIPSHTNDSRLHTNFCECSQLMHWHECHHQIHRFIVQSKLQVHCEIASNFLNQGSGG